MQPALTAGSATSFGARGRLFAICAMTFLVGTAIGVVLSAGLTQCIFAVRLTFVAIVMLGALAVVAYRPVLFPFTVYVFAVPFEMMLATMPGSVTKLLQIVSVAVWLLVLTDRRRVVGAPASVLGWGALLVWSAVTLTWSPAPQTAAGLWTEISLFVPYCIAAMLRTRRDETYFFAGSSILAGVALACTGIYHYLTGSDIAKNATGAARLILHDGQNSLDPNHLASLLVVPFAFAMVFALRPPSVTKWLGLAAVPVLCGGIFVTAARGSLIAVGVIVAYLLVFYRARLQLAAAAAAGLLVSVAFPSVWLRFAQDSQASGRFDIWGLAWLAFKAHWLGGIGASQFRLAYADAYLQSWLPPGSHPWFEDSHNLLVSTGVEIGIIGIALMALAWYLQFRVVSVVPKTSDLYELRVAIQAGTIGMLVVAMSLDIMAFKDVWLAFMYALFVRNAYVGERSAEPQHELPSPHLEKLEPIVNGWRRGSFGGSRTAAES